MICFLLIFLSSVALAAPSDVQLSLLIEAKTKHEFQAANNDGSEIVLLRSQCKLELELQKIPISCFAEYKIEEQRGLISFAENSLKTKSLSSFCRRAAELRKNPDELKEALRSKNLSESCRRSIESRADDLAYQLGEVRELDRFLK